MSTDINLVEDVTGDGVNYNGSFDLFANESVIDSTALGFIGVLNPKADSINGMRLNMFGSVIKQWLVLKEPEGPDWATGFEQEFLKYVESNSIIKSRVEVLEIVPKFATVGNAIGSNPTKMIIYRDLLTEEIGCFELNKYVVKDISLGFGYENKSDEDIIIKRGSEIREGSRIVSSEASRKGYYRMGLNLNTAYLGDNSTIEDARKVSDRVANKFKFLKCEQITVRIPQGGIPVASYGSDEDNYNIIPSVGEYVRMDGIVMALRKFNNTTIFTDLNRDSLNSNNPMMDDVRISQIPCGKVVDVEIKCPDYRVLNDNMYFKQLFDINEQITDYHEKILKYYISNCQYKEITPEFNTVVTEAMVRVMSSGRRIHGLKNFSQNKHTGVIVNSTQPYIEIELKIVKYEPLQLGSKIANRHGGKGMVVEIAKEADMARDDFGFVSDFYSDPTEPTRRTNISGIYEHILNRIGQWIVKFHIDNIPRDQAIANTMYFFDKLSPADGSIKRQHLQWLVDTMGVEDGENRYLDEFRENGNLYFTTGCSNKNIRPETVNHLLDHFDVKTSPVTYYYYDKAGNRCKARTKKNVVIARQFNLLINKYPKPSAPGFGYSNKIGQPIAPSGQNKLTSPVSQNTYKYGEAERRVLEGAKCGKALSRNMNLLGNSIIGPNVVIEEVLNSRFPTRIKAFSVTDDELKDNNQGLQVGLTMTKTHGFDFQNTGISEKDANFIFDNVIPYIEEGN